MKEKEGPINSREGGSQYPSRQCLNLHLIDADIQVTNCHKSEAFSYFLLQPRTRPIKAVLNKHGGLIYIMLNGLSMIRHGKIRLMKSKPLTFPRKRFCRSCLNMKTSKINVKSKLIKNKH